MSELIDLVADLVRINSINPDLVSGGAGEGEIARFIANWAQRAGLEAELQEAAPGRPNVIARARGSGGGRSLMLNAHLDTVGVEDMDAPLEARIEGGRMYGRGTYDMKSSLAACLMTALRAKDMDLRGDVIVTGVADEEYASIGSDAIIAEWSRWAADAVIVTEPTEMDICVAHKGFVWLDVHTEGVAAHGSRPHLGVDAIARMGRVLVELEVLDRTLQANPSHPYLKSGSLHASVINGGQGWSAYPAHCHLQVERRTLPGESPELVRDQIRIILERLAAQDPSFKASVSLNLARGSFEVDPDALIVRTLAEQARQTLGAVPAMAGNTFWMDAALFAEAGIPTVVFGPHGDGAHARVEWVDLKSVEETLEVLSATAAAFCA